MINSMNNRRINWVWAFMCVFFSCTLMAQTELFRYTNDEGNTVIGYTIPSQFIARGYEVITPSGKVIRQVAAAPTGEEIEKQKLRNEIRQVYSELKKRYNNQDDLERVKLRKLQAIKTKISVNESTIVNLKRDIEDMISKAAAKERAGRQVPKALSEKIIKAQAKLKRSEAMLVTRNEQYQNTEKQFDSDIAIFSQGRQMEFNSQMPSEQTSTE